MRRILAYHDLPTGERMNVLLGQLLLALTATQQGRTLAVFIQEEVLARGMDPMDWHSAATVKQQLFALTADVFAELDPDTREPADIEQLEAIIRRHGYEVADLHG